MNILEQKSFIAAIPPFDRLQPAELEMAASAMDIAYFKKGETIIQQGIIPEVLYLIIKGVVQETEGDDSNTSYYAQQDSFDAIALLEGESKGDFVAFEESICYLLPKEFFLMLVHQNAGFKEFYYQRLSKHLQELLEYRKNKEFSSFTTATISEAYLHPPVVVDATTSVYAAAEIMSTLKTSFTLVKRDQEVGIVTNQDLRDHVILRGYSVTEPVNLIASYNLIGLNLDDLLLQALLTMTKHVIKHLLIYDADGEIVGVLEQVDLVTYLSTHTPLVIVQIERAKDMAQLKAASYNITKMIRSLHVNGVKLDHLMRIVNELNKYIYRKLFTFLATPEIEENVCLIVMGSEGRGEQILKTDQDNAIIIRNSFPPERVTKLAKELHEALQEFGYPPCPGKVMINNPAWCKSLAGFQKDISQTIFHLQGPLVNLLHLAIFFDAKAVSGDPRLLKAAKTYLHSHLRDDSAFFAYFAKPTITFPTPLGFFANLVVEKSQHRDQLNIKKGGIFPIVHGIRSFALEFQLEATNTFKRLGILTDKGVFDSAFASDINEALTFMLALRLRFELEKLDQGEAYDDYINPTHLNKLERDLLKDSFKIVNQFKQLVTHHFHLEMVT